MFFFCYGQANEQRGKKEEDGQGEKKERKEL